MTRHSGVVFVVTAVLLAGCVFAGEPSSGRTFDPVKDLLSLHYDHAPDKDDGHSAAADRTILETLFGREWISNHVVAVSGAYGINAGRFNPRSDRVMDAAWNACGGWLAAHTNREQAVTVLADRWGDTLRAGGDIWVKEGGQSDVTAATVKQITDRLPGIVVSSRVHVVQHSNWNENKTTVSALTYTREHTEYIRIRDANRYLNIKGGNAAFETAARKHPVFGNVWDAAFEYYPPAKRLDFSDTGELLHILGLGELGFEAFAKRFLKEQRD